MNKAQYAVVWILWLLLLGTFAPFIFIGIAAYIGWTMLNFGWIIANDITENVTKGWLAYNKEHNNVG